MFALLVAWLAGSAVQADAPQRIDIDIAKFAFGMESVTIHKGDTIAWTNRDIAPHTATDSNYDWDTGEITQGQTVELVFDKPGRYEYICAYHPSMQAVIIVLE